MGRPLDHLGALVRAVTHAKDLEDALSGIGYELERMELQPRIVMLVLLEPGGIWHIVATWNRQETVLSAGLRVPKTLTPALVEFSERLARGEVTNFRAEDVDFGLLSDVYEAEDIRSWIASPLVEDRQILGAVAGALGTREVLGVEGELLLEAFGRGVGPLLLDLLRSGASTGPDDPPEQADLPSD